MPTLNINGKRVTVGEEFLSLPPEQQSATIEEIAASLGTKPSEQPYSGGILPFSKDAQGNVSFDSNAGLAGVFKRAFMLPGQVSRGEIDPRESVKSGRALEFSAAFSPLPAAMRAGEAIIPGVKSGLRPRAAPAPSAEALKSAAEQGYTGARNLGVEIKGDTVKTFATGVKTALEQDGIIAELAPKTHAIISKLASPPEGAFATIGGLDAARRALGEAAGDATNATERKAADRAIERLDELLSGLPQESVLAGPAAEASSLLTRARGNYAAAKRSAKITGAEEQGELAAAVANSGQNLDNAIRQRLKSILANPKQARGFTQEELDALGRVAKGKRGANFARIAGNLLGGGGGLGALLTGAVGGGLGAVTGGPVGAAIGATAAPATGNAFKRLAAALTKRGVRKVDEMTRKRSPLYEETPTPMVPPPFAGGRQALVRALLASQLLSPE